MRSFFGHVLVHAIWKSAAGTSFFLFLRLRKTRPARIAARDDEHRITTTSIRDKQLRRSLARRTPPSPGVGVGAKIRAYVSTLSLVQKPAIKMERW